MAIFQRPLTSRLQSWPDPFWLEIFSAITALAWCAGSIFLDGERGHKEDYRLAMELLPNTSWEMVAAAVGVGQIIGCLSATRKIRVILAAIVAIFWGLLGASIYAAASTALSVIFYGAWGAANSWSMFLLARRHDD